MAESQDDRNVDQCIQDIQAALDRLKAEQKQDVADETGEEADEKPFEGKNLKDAEKEAYVRVRAHTRRRHQADEKSDSY